MAEGDTIEDPKDLRSKLEAALADKGKAEQELHTFKVKELITEKKFDLVEVDDLKGVDLKEAEAKAAKIQQDREDIQVAVAKKLASKMGIPEDSLEAVVREALGRNEVTNPVADATGRARQLGQVPGTPLPDPNDPTKKGLHGLDAIRAGIAAKLPT